MKKIVIALLISISSAQFGFSQNIGINPTGAAPAASAMLDVSSTNSGLLIPRVALTSLASSTPISSPATSLLIYNTATAGSGATAVVPGYYYWGGAGKWIPLLNPNAGVNGGWTLIGNTGTTAGTHFIGTTNAVDFVIKTNNTEKARVTSSGSVGIGSSTFNGTSPEKLLVDAGTTTSKNLMTGKGSVNGFLQINVQNSSNGTQASSDIVATNDAGTDLINFIDMGINSSGNTDLTYPVLGGLNTAYLYATGSNADFVIGNGDANGALRFFTGGTNQGTRMNISSTGKVGIGVTSPTHLLELSIDDAVKPGGGVWSAPSDRRLKKDIKPFTDGLSVLKKVNPVTFQYNGKANMPDNGKVYTGVIAQDMQAIAPYTVTTFTDVPTKTEYLSYDGNSMTYILINAVKEQQAIIESLTKQLEEQNTRLKKLESK